DPRLIQLIQYCSMVFRRDTIEKAPTWVLKSDFTDQALCFYCAQRGGIGYINAFMGHYRKHLGGYWSGAARTRKLAAVVRFYREMAETLPAVKPLAHESELQLLEEIHRLASVGKRLQAMHAALALARASSPLLLRELLPTLRPRLYSRP